MDGRDRATLVRDHLTEAHFMQADGRLLIERLRQVPVTNRYRFKLGKARVTRIGESSYKRSYTAMSFAPRPIM